MEITNLLITLLGTMIVNIPFGYLREGVKKFSLLWFVYIHIPVPLVIILRTLLDIELTWTLFPMLFAAYFLGQYTGKRVRQSKEHYDTL